MRLEPTKPNMQRNHNLTLKAFSDEQFQAAKLHLATKVVHMMGRKLEEGDWNSVYCAAKGIPYTGWSNLNIDVNYQGLGVEQKASADFWIAGPSNQVSVWDNNDASCSNAFDPH